MLANLARKMPANKVARKVAQKMLRRRSMMPSGHSLSGYLVPYPMVWEVSMANKKAVAKFLTPTYSNCLYYFFDDHIHCGRC